MERIESLQTVTTEDKAAARILTTRFFLFLATACLALEFAAIGAYLADNIFLLTALLLLSGIPFVFAVYQCFRATAFQRGCLTIIIAFAALARLLLVPLDPPRLSTDLYRYLWDGRVQVAGVNPYSYIPADRQLEILRDPEIYPKINRKDYAHTIYPPFAELWFYAVAAVHNSAWWLRAAMALADLLTIAALVRLLKAVHFPAERVLVYAWHPLPIWEFASAGHIDAVMILFVVLAFLALAEKKAALAGLALGCAILTKFVPVVLLPVLHRRRDRKMLLTCALTIGALYLTYFLTSGSSVLGFLPSYTREERIQTGERFYFLNLLNHLLHWIRFPFRISSQLFIAAALVGLTVLGLRAFLGDDFGRTNKPVEALDPINENRRMLKYAFLLVLTFSALLSFDYPWYYAWLVPFLTVVPSAAGLFITLACFVLYRAIHEYTRQNYFMLHSQIWLPFLVLLWLDLWRNKGRAKRKT
jgi:alpha-1,6-mannosyltransferase